MVRQRRAVARQQQTVQKFDTKWTLNDKKRLLAGLRRFDSGNVRAIRRNYLPNRSDKEIIWFTNRMRVKGGLLRDEMNIGATRLKANIECWLRLIEDLTIHNKDYSFNLCEVLRKMADSESHDPASTRYNPDWSQVYHYLVSALSGLELPTVGQIEATVILMLLEKLMVHLKTLDVGTQRWLARKKFEMVALRSGATEEAVNEAKRALETDLVAAERQNQLFNGSNPTGPVPGKAPLRYPSYITGTSTNVVVNPRSMSDSKLCVQSTAGASQPVTMETVTKGNKVQSASRQTVTEASKSGSQSERKDGTPMDTLTNETNTMETSSSEDKICESNGLRNGSEIRTGIWSSRGMGENGQGEGEQRSQTPGDQIGGTIHIGGRKRGGRGLERCESSVRLISAEQQKPNYGLNPLCVPIRYINPKARIKIEAITSPGGFADPQRLRGPLREVKQASAKKDMC